VLVGAVVKSTTGVATAVTPNVDYFLVGYTNGVVGSSNLGNYDMFVGKYDISGMILWTNQCGTAGNERNIYSSAAAVDASGNIYVVAACTGALNGIPSGGSRDACYFVFDTAGNERCAGQVGGLFSDYFYGVAVDSVHGFFCAVGVTQSDPFGGTPRSGTTDSICIKFQFSTTTSVAGCWWCSFLL